MNILSKECCIGVRCICSPDCVMNLSLWYTMPPYDRPCTISFGLFLLTYHRLPNSHSIPTNKIEPEAFWSDNMNVVAKLQLASATSFVS